MPATEFAPSRDLTQPWQCDTQHEMSKVLRLPRKTTFHMLRNTSECHEVPCLPRETKQRDVSNLQKCPLLQNLWPSRGRLRSCAASSEHTLNPQGETGTLATQSGTNEDYRNYQYDDCVFTICLLCALDLTLFFLLSQESRDFLSHNTQFGRPQTVEVSVSCGRPKTMG